MFWDFATKSKMPPLQVRNSLLHRPHRRRIINMTPTPILRRLTLRAVKTPNAHLTNLRIAKQIQILLLRRKDFGQLLADVTVGFGQPVGVVSFCEPRASLVDDVGILGGGCGRCTCGRRRRKTLLDNIVNIVEFDHFHDSSFTTIPHIGIRVIMSIIHLLLLRHRQRSFRTLTVLILGRIGALLSFLPLRRRGRGSVLLGVDRRWR
mmetsp:Transcript_31475/g.57014  ORF Transcript_31475/g.57014 Transcript_31475/m.57014 type:complete len:206 (+) Transcript_31475:1133-1750(+)